MKRLERWIGRALLTYPKRYRDVRAEEMSATLLEAAAWQPLIESLRDLLNVAISGLRLRFALTDNQASGRALGLAASPALTLAGTFGLMLFVYGEWLPSVNHDPIRLGFGPFMTAGPVAYVAWVIAAVVAYLVPRYRRWLATLAALVTLALAVFGGGLGLRPPMVPLLVLVGLAIPSIVGPSVIDDGLGRTKLSGLAVGSILVLWIFELFNTGRGGSNMGSVFYDGALRSMAMYMPCMSVGVLICIGCAFARSRREWAGAIAVIAIPFALVGTSLPIGKPLTSYSLPAPSLIANTSWFLLLCVSLSTLWVADMAGQLPSPGSAEVVR